MVREDIMFCQQYQSILRFERRDEEKMGVRDMVGAGA